MIEPTVGSGEAAEIEMLRHRIAELEEQLLETEEWANRLVGVAQERSYWLDRWHIDLNAIMRRPAAARARAAVRAGRLVFRLGKEFRRRLSAEA